MFASVVTENQPRQNVTAEPEGGIKMNKNTRARKHNGIALVSVMCAVILMLLLGWGALSLGLRGQIFAVRAGSQVTARCAADAGLTQAIAEMNDKLGRYSFDDSTLPQATDQILPACNANYSYTVTGDKAAGYTVQSVGSSRNANRQVTATLRLRGLFDFGILVRESATFFSGSFVDGYHSSDPTCGDVWVQVASVNPDPHCVEFKPGSGIDGEVLNGVDFDFPKVYPPALPDTASEIYAMGEKLKIGPADSGTYTGIRLLQDKLVVGTETNVTYSELEIEDGHVDLYITGDVWLGQGCEITIGHDSSLTIYVDGDFIICNSGSINNRTETPSAFALYGTGENQKFELKAKSDFYGITYAPDADIEIKAKGDVYGAFVGNTFDSKSSGLIWYDAALRKVDVDDIGVRFVIDRWREE